LTTNDIDCPRSESSTVDNDQQPIIAGRRTGVKDHWKINKYSIIK